MSNDSQNVIVETKDGTPPPKLHALFLATYHDEPFTTDPLSILLHRLARLPNPDNPFYPLQSPPHSLSEDSGNGEKEE